MKLWVEESEGVFRLYATGEALALSLALDAWLETRPMVGSKSRGWYVTTNSGERMPQMSEVWR